MVSKDVRGRQLTCPKCGEGGAGTAALLEIEDIEDGRLKVFDCWERNWKVAGGEGKG